jgi:L-ascorbate metabolism protein UlaG (beta-lactamase superfamily)
MLILTFLIGALAVPATTSRPVVLRYLGTAGWEISDGNVVILVDPYLSRIKGPPPPGGTGQTPSDPRPAYSWGDVATPDVAAIDAHVQRADLVLVTHTHYDHVLDVPHIALKTHTSVVGTESTQNVMRANGVPEKQLITVRGGEDYQFAGFSLRVVPSIHSPLDQKRYFSSAVAPPGMKAPLTLQQMHPEGGTLAYLIRIGAHQILAFGGMNYLERELLGLRPDVVLVGAGGSRKELYDYCGRLLRALEHPALVLPTHWDNFLLPFDASQQPAMDALKSFIDEVRAASPNTKVIVPKYFQPIALDNSTR